MATSTIALVRSALVTLVQAQVPAECKVRAYPPTGGDAVRENTIWFERISGNQEHLAFGGSREEQLTVEGVCYAPGSGGDGDTAASTEARAIAFLGDVEDALRLDADLDGVSFHAEVESYSSELRGDDEGWVGWVQFQLSVEAHI